MTKRREKAKAQATQLSKQLAIQVKKEKDESLVESGKYYLDLSKLIFAGVIIVCLMDFSKEKSLILILGFLGMLIFYFIGCIWSLRCYWHNHFNL